MYIELLNNPARDINNRNCLEYMDWNCLYSVEFYQEDDDLLDWESGYQYKDNEYISPMVEL